MSPRFKPELESAFTSACKALAPDADVRVAVDRPKNPQMGDFACTAAMQLARPLRRPPGDIAAQILRAWKSPDFVERAEVVGGYINVRIRPEEKAAIVAEVLNNPEKFGQGGWKHEHILLEFVSANPTGPLHIGHGRAAAYGDSLARILKYAGWSVAREYYVNDSGRQADILAASVWLRHRWQAMNWDKMPLGTYRGRYLAEVAQSLKGEMNHLGLRQKSIEVYKQLDERSMRVEGQTDAVKIAEAEKEITKILVTKAREAWEAHGGFDEFRGLVCDKFVEKIKADMDEMGVKFDRWFSERRELHKEEKIDAALDRLRALDRLLARAQDSLFPKEGAQWFRASAYGDEKDRVVRRSNREYTYFAADIAYHDDKFRRLTPAVDVPIRLVNVLGADHHGYAPRLKAVVKALDHKPESLESKFIQFVALVRGGERVKMSTRAGDFVPLRELLDDVGRDAVRFFFVSRSNDQHMDFDVDVAIQQNSKNPVFYVQYACARAGAVLRKAGGAVSPPSKEVISAWTRREDEMEDEMKLCGFLGEFSEVIESAANGRAPHVLANWLVEFAGAFHSYYEKVPVLTAQEPDKSARIALLEAIRTVMSRGLDLLGVEVPREM